jgi:hypothetical protein
MTDAPPETAKRSRRAERTLRLERVRIEHVRGIPDHLALEFSKGQSTSVVILGDNGSGKSSIVDAVQFALQAQVHTATGGAAAARIVSALTHDLPRVVVELADGTEISREVSRETVEGKDGDDDVTRLRVSSEGTSGFEGTPLVLRRSDILRFWDTPPEQRQLMFLRYFRPGRAPLELPHERQVRAQAEELRAKERRRNARARVVERADAEPTEVPSNLQDFNHWVDANFFGGFDVVQRKRRNPRRLPRDDYTAIQEMRAALKAVRAAEGEVGRAARAGGGRGDEGLIQVMTEASATVTESFRAISPNSPVTEIRLGAGEATSVALDVEMTLTNGRVADPARVLSEANRDLLAFLIFIAIAKAAAARGQAEVIILDDVFQSVDSPIRVAALDHVMDDLRGWQFILTAHDRLWQEQLLTVMRRNNQPPLLYEIISWSPDHGPDIRSADTAVSTALAAAIASGDTASIAMHAGRLLEQLAGILSWTLPTSVKRRQGDRYTLGDLWPGVFAELRRTTVAPVAAEIDRYLHLRNLLGMHVNDWAAGVSLIEVRRFAENVIALLSAIRCEKCGRWIEASPERRTWVCRCGTTRLTPPPPADPA